MIHRRSYAELRALYESGEISPVDVAESALEHAAHADVDLNAFALLDRDRALTGVGTALAREVTE